MDRDLIFEQWERQFSLDTYSGKDEADTDAATFDGSQKAGEAVRYWQEFCDRILDEHPARAPYEAETYTLRYALVRILKHLSDLPCFDQNNLPYYFWDFLEHDVLQAIESESVGISRLFLHASSTIVRYLVGSGGKREGRRLGTSLLGASDRRFGNTSAESTLLARLVAESYVYNSPHKFGTFERQWTSDDAEPVILRHLAYLELFGPPYEAAALNYFYGYARVLLIQEKPDEAATLIRRAFDGRQACYGEVHTESDRFIDGLIRSLCETESGKSYYGTGFNNQLSWVIVGHLVHHAVAQERLSEAETLFTECGRTEGLTRRTSALSADVDFQPRSGWPCIQSQFVNLKTPGEHWYWEDSRMYLCRWNEVTLAPVYPFDPFPRAPIKLIEGDRNAEVVVSQRAGEELAPKEPTVKRITKTDLFLRGWGSDLDKKTSLRLDMKFMLERLTGVRLHRPTALPSWTVKRPSDFKRDDMVYSIEDIGDWEININIPFVPYEHFQSSRAWRAGLTYIEYIDLLRNNIMDDWGLRKARDQACSDEDGKKRMRMLYVSVEEVRNADNDDSESDVITSGLFNGVPSGLSLIDTGGTIGGYSLVSSSWTDWTRFTVYQTILEQTPNLTFQDKKPVKCHGYIMGRWARDNLKEQWIGIQLFVVDADFGVAGQKERFNFVLNPDTFMDMNTRSLCSLEKLAICGSLNPRLFRYSAPPIGPPGASLWRPSKKTKKQDTVLLDTFWEEMNRREAWDRMFEKRLRPILNEKYSNDDDKEALAELMAEKAQEEQRRKSWDAQHQKAQMA